MCELHHVASLGIVGQLLLFPLLLEGEVLEDLLLALLGLGERGKSG
jgi:hypothetical protein